MKANIPDKMAGVLLTGHGGFDKLEFRQDLAVPVTGAGDVLVRVEAAAVNNTDVNTRIGWYSKSGEDEKDASWAGEAIRFPRIQGIDACGVIVGVGKGVSQSRLGERVLIEPCLLEAGGKALDRPWFFGSECDGGFAEYTVVSARHAFAVNSLLSGAELASFPCSYSTAENMLTRANVTDKDRIFITGASGGVGSAAVQLAKARGAYVIAVTSGDKAQELKQIGADKTVQRDDDFIAKLGGESVDVVVDLVAGQKWPVLLDILRPGGRYAVAGAIGGPLVELDIRTLYLKDLSFFGCTTLEPEVFPNLVLHIESGRIKPLVSKTFPLHEIQKAQEMFLEKKFIGKIVLTVWDGK